MYESIKTLEIRTSKVFNLSFPNLSFPTTLSCFLFFSFIIDLDFLITAIIAQIFIPAAELFIPTGTQTNEASADIETQQLTVEVIISKFTT